MKKKFFLLIFIFLFMTKFIYSSTLPYYWDSDAPWNNANFETTIQLKALNNQGSNIVFDITNQDRADTAINHDYHNPPAYVNAWKYETPNGEIFSANGTSFSGIPENSAELYINGGVSTVDNNENGDYTYLHGEAKQEGFIKVMENSKLKINLNFQVNGCDKGSWKNYSGYWFKYQILDYGPSNGEPSTNNYNIIAGNILNNGYNGIIFSTPINEIHSFIIDLDAGHWYKIIFDGVLDLKAYENDFLSGSISVNSSIAPVPISDSINLIFIGLLIISLFLIKRRNFLI